MGKAIYNMFDGEALNKALLPFLNNLLTTTAIMAINLLIITRNYHLVMSVLAGMVFLLGLYGMILNNWEFMQRIFPNPTPKPLRSYLNSSGPKPLAWFIQFFKTICKEPRFIIIGSLTLIIIEITTIAGLMMMIINAKEIL